MIFANITLLPSGNYDRPRTRVLFLARDVARLQNDLEERMQEMIPQRVRYERDLEFFFRITMFESDLRTLFIASNNGLIPDEQAATLQQSPCRYFRRLSHTVIRRSSVREYEETTGMIDRFTCASERDTYLPYFTQDDDQNTRFMDSENTVFEGLDKNEHRSHHEHVVPFFYRSNNYRPDHRNETLLLDAEFFGDNDNDEGISLID